MQGWLLNGNFADLAGTVTAGKKRDRGKPFDPLNNDDSGDGAGRLDKR
jgi:hypothetical protein